MSRLRQMAWSLLPVTLLFLSALSGSAAAAAAASPASPILEGLGSHWVGWETWAPYVVRIQTGEEAIAGILEVDFNASDYWSSHYRTTRFRRPISIPAHADEEVTVWVYTSMKVPATIRLWEDGRLLAEATAEYHRQPSQVAVLGPTPLPDTFSLPTGAVPPSGVGLARFQTLIVQGEAVRELSNAQRQAVAEWVMAGGHLVVAGGPGAGDALAVLPQRSLPVTLGATRTEAALLPLADWLDQDEAPGPGRVRAIEAAGGTVVVGTAERPLIWRHPLGLGMVTLLAFDPFQSPFDAWPHTADLIQALTADVFGDSRDEETTYGFPKFLPFDVQKERVEELPTYALPRTRFPTLGSLMVVLLAYVGATGWAVFALAQRQRFWRCQLGVSAAALVGTAALVLGGIVVGGRDLLHQVMSVVHIDPTTGFAMQETATGILAPLHPQLEVQLSGPSLAVGRGQLDATMPINQYLERQGFPLPKVELLHGQEETRLRLPATGRWAERKVTFIQSLQTEVGEIRANLQLAHNGTLVGTLQNETPFFLEDAVIVGGHNLLRLGNLAPGAEVPVVFDPAAHRDFDWKYLWFGEEREGSWRLREDPVASHRRELARYALPLYAPSMREGQDFLLTPWIRPLTFAAFTRAPVGPEVTVAGRRSPTLTLMNQPLGYTIPPGPFLLPPTLVPPQLVAIEGSMTGYGYSTSGDRPWLKRYDGIDIDPEEGAVTFRYQVPPPAAEVMVLTLRNPADPDPWLTPRYPVLEIYNWANKGWDLLGEGSAFHLRRPDAFLGPENQVLVRLKHGKQPLFLSHLPPELMVQGFLAE